MSILVRAPSNIALVKYMGKDSDASSGSAGPNVPTNGSLSMTLDSLCTLMEFRRVSGSSRFVAELPKLSGYTARAGSSAQAPSVPKLSQSGTERLLAHVERVRGALPVLLADLGGVSAGRDGWEIRSANTFPAASGIASSASSFAAVTLATALAGAADPARVKRALGDGFELRRRLARLSRQGSGSSCRSFEGSFVEWQGEDARAVKSAMPKLLDLVLVIGAEEKEVSSSQAHLRVKSSPLWEGRVSRVQSRLARLGPAISKGDFSDVAAIAWEELWEMHSLFHTASEPFTYWLPGSVKALRWAQAFRREAIVTMDAGPNVHFLVPESTRDLWLSRLREQFPHEEVLVDAQGSGAEVLSIEGGPS